MLWFFCSFEVPRYGKIPNLLNQLIYNIMKSITVFDVVRLVGVALVAIAACYCFVLTVV